MSAVCSSRSIASVRRPERSPKPDSVGRVHQVPAGLEETGHPLVAPAPVSAPMHQHVGRHCSDLLVGTLTVEQSEPPVTVAGMAGRRARGDDGFWMQRRPRRKALQHGAAAGRRPQTAPLRRSGVWDSDVAHPAGVSLNRPTQVLPLERRLGAGAPGSSNSRAPRTASRTLRSPEGPPPPVPSRRPVGVRVCIQIAGSTIKSKYAAPLSGTRG